MPTAETPPNGVVPASTNPVFSVLIVGYNSPGDIRILLDSLRALPSWSEVEILIAENGDREKAAMEALALDFQARILFLPNPGFGAACNRLAALARGEILLLANPDLRFGSDILPGLRARLAEPGVGAVGPLLRDQDGTEQISWNLPLDLYYEFVESLGLQTPYRRKLIREKKAESPRGPWSVGFATAACLAIPRSLFDEVGGFDEGFFLNGEDIELCDRIRDRGYRILVDPVLEAFHGNSRIQGRNLGRFVADRLEGKRKYLSRRYRGWRLFVARALWVKMVTIRLVAGLFLLRGTERTRLAGYRRILTASLGLWFRSLRPSGNPPRR